MLPSGVTEVLPSFFLDPEELVQPKEMGTLVRKNNKYIYIFIYEDGVKGVSSSATS